MSLSQQVMTLLIRGEECLPQLDYATSDPSVAAGVRQQWPMDRTVHLVTPGREEAI